MAFEINKFEVTKKKRLEKNTFNVECNIENSVEIDKILSVCHSAQSETVEVLNGVINYTGYIDICIIYLTVDGEIGTINSSCPFTSKFEDEDIMVGDKVFIKVTVEDFSIDSVTNSNIKINCICEQTSTLIGSREISNITSGDDDICIKEDEISVNTLIGQTKSNFVVVSDFSIKEPIKKIISSDSQVSVKNVESGVNFVSVSGEVITRILYLTDSDHFENSYVTENFKEEVELNGVSRDTISEAFAFIKRSNIKCEIDNVDKGVEVKLTIPVDLFVTAYEEKKIVVVKDVYSIQNELQVSTQSFEMTKQFLGDIFESKIDGSLSLNEEQPRVDKIMFVGGSNLAVTNSYIKDKEVYVEGVTKTNVIYLNDENNSLNSVVIEVPFVISDKADYKDDTRVFVSAIITDVDVAVKKGREFLFDAKIKVRVDFDCEEVGAVISSVEAVNEFPEHDCAIELVFAKSGQTAWDIAKSIRVKEEVIMLQNPNLEFPLPQDENVVIYYQKQ